MIIKNRSIIFFIPQVLSPNDSSSPSFLSFLCPLLPKTKILSENLRVVLEGLFAMGGMRGPGHPLFQPPLESGEEIDLLWSFSTNILLGDFVLASFFPRLTPWLVAVAVILVVLDSLTIGSIFFTWRLR